MDLKHYPSFPPRGERRFEKPLRREVGRPGFEESAGPVVPGRKEYTRADSDNWRTLREEQDEDDGESGNNWRLSGPRRDGTRPSFTEDGLFLCLQQVIWGTRMI